MRSTRLIALTLACAIVSSLPFLFSNAALAAAPKPPAKAKTGSNSGSLDKLDTDTSKITAAEGTTATAIRGATAAPPSSSARFGQTFKLRGQISSDSENNGNAQDPANVPHPLALPPSTMTPFALPAGKMFLKDLPNIQQIAANAGSRLGQQTINVALLGQHKYMIADCLGVKVSVGTFNLKLGSPSISIVDEGVVASYRIDHVSFTAFKLRFRPDVTDLAQPCHFSGRVELGGAANNVTIELRYNPVIDIEKCRVGEPGHLYLHIDIGSIHLEPLPPGVSGLEDMFKDMVVDALNDSFYYAQLLAGATDPTPMLLNQVSQTLDDVLEVDCPFKGSEVGNKTVTAVESASSRATSAARSASGPKPVGSVDGIVGSSAVTPPKIGPVDGIVGSSPAQPPDGVTAASAASGPKPFQPVDGVVGSSPPPPATGRGGAFDIVANAELKGRLGHIVIAFPDGAKIREARIDIFKSGDANRIRTDYGNATVELLPGTYDLVIDGRKITGIPVQSHHDTRLHVGVLRLHGGKETRFDFFEPGGKERLHTYYGETDVGLPAGDVEIMINGQREKVTIENGVITDF